MTTREAFLGRVRAEVGRARPLFSAVPAARPGDPAGAAAAVRRELAERWPEALARFVGEFERVGGSFHRVAGPGEVPALVARLARERDARRVAAWPPATLGLEVAGPLASEGLEVAVMPAGSLRDAGERARLRATVAAAELGLTGVDLAVAETGTLVLRSGPGRPRSTSLLPASHVAVFGRAALVETLAQVGVLLEAWHSPALAVAGGMINFITGPSRTADIELTLTRGVHGPREVHAVLVEAWTDA